MYKDYKWYATFTQETFRFHKMFRNQREVAWGEWFSEWPFPKRSWARANRSAEVRSSYDGDAKSTSVDSWLISLGFNNAVLSERTNKGGKKQRKMTAPDSHNYLFILELLFNTYLYNILYYICILWDVQRGFKLYYCTSLHFIYSAAETINILSLL